MSKRLLILIGSVVVLAAAFIVFRYTATGASALWTVSDQGRWLLPLIVISSLIDSINPCAFSVLLLTVAFLLSIGRLRSSILRIGGAYVLGIFVAYMLIGLGLLQVLHVFSTPHFMALLGAWLMIGLGGINIVNEFVPSFPIKLRIPQVAHSRMAKLMDTASVPAALVLGALVGLCEFPCTGGPYLTALGLLYDRATYLSGLGYLLLYNVIFVLPLVIALLIASDKGVLGRLQEWRNHHLRSLRLWSGIAMVALGIIILTI